MTTATQTEDCAVFHIGMLDDEYAANFDKEWLVDVPETDTALGITLEFKTEDDACAFQRQWRRNNGLNEMTGEPEAN